MSDHDKATDPIDKAYAQAEAALSDEAARAARRARVLGAVAQEPVAPPLASAPRFRRSAWRGGGWLVAAGVAGVSLFLATRFYQPVTIHRQAASTAVSPMIAPAAPAPVNAAAPPTPVPAPGSAPVRTSKPAIGRAQETRSSSPGAVPAPPPSEASDSRALSRTLPAAPSPAPAPPPATAAATTPPPLPVPAVPPPPPPPPPPPVMRAPPPPQLRESAPTSAGRGGQGPAAKPSVSGSFSASESPAVPPADPAARLRAAAAAGRIADVEALLGQGVPVDAADADGNTALMRSVQANRPAVVALLRSHGASLDLKNSAGKGARDMAAAIGDAALDKALGLAP